MSNLDSSAVAHVVGDVFVNRPEPETAFGEVKHKFEESDALIANLEGGFGTDAEPLSFSAPNIRANYDCVEGIEQVDFDVLSLANNHAMDFGPDGLVETLDVLEDKSIAAAGAGRNRELAERPVVFERSGVTIGVVAYEATTLSLNIAMQAAVDRPGMNVLLVRPDYPDNVSEYDLRRMEAAVSEASEEVDVLITMMHFGAAVDHTITESQRVIAETAAQAGADLVVGAHPHVLQAVDSHDSTPILYSLGHFLFDSLEFKLGLGALDYFPRIASATAIAELGLSKDGLDDLRLYPCYIEDFDPYLPDPDSEEYAYVADILLDTSERDGITLQQADDHLVVPLD